MSLWTSKDAISATGGTTPCDWEATGLSIDTRSIQAGDMFVALTDQRDGHDFVADALAKGAAAALVSHIPAGLPVDAPLLLVNDVLAGLEDMARFARARTQAQVIGVTGSVGKTSTKEMLRTALATQGVVHAADRSFNNHWGVPLTLARMPQNADFAVIEIGMNHAGEIRPLSRMAQLDVAIITTVAPVHMEAFNDISEIAQAKAEIFEGLKPTGTAIVNGDIETFDVVRRDLGDSHLLVTFGQGATCEFRALDIQTAGSITRCAVEVMGQKTQFEIQAAGAHFATNGLAVLAAAGAIGADLEKTITALANWTAPAGRGARHIIDLGAGASCELIDESYNANPKSMGAALDVLASAHAKGRRIAILGEMGELGADELALHAELAALPSVAQVDQFHLVGPMMQSLHAALPAAKRGVWVAQADELVHRIENLLSAGDVIMVKGSNYTRVSTVVSAIQKLGAA
ncbi:UDP-N-acetylmuramoyl-tripeptide--D-alanyl-D-alanine ligase [Amylibacter marinus]|uniref:UDP-N-acetylmuramoyl-tripeptide--D-alanyl-D-alanine ligase n=1 Tax=Amylibacter marinus TaxID=1475483 RepID=A0ABQ5VU04_9RHOB|nr:UDP-N-acetylmuramoyl-tripeptide--D-alanyl-D-alanine ligase [Amylibacter marinus]GLQ34876.1 UDP-N-acetylmuramoyl-tripeptide--D-alanyl-D-alanine ligase [Amylibacter marinus]